MKKLLSIVLTVLIILTSSTMSIFAEKEGTESNPWLIGPTGSESSVTAYIKDNVLYINGTGEMVDFSSGSAPWYGETHLFTSVTIGNGVTKIGSYAFYNNENILNVSIPNGLTTIGDHAFDFCKGITTITVPSDVTTIEEAAFENCEELESITLLANITSIENYCFSECKKLASISIPSNVNTIKYKAFEGCATLTDIEIPQLVTTIESAAFNNCSNLETVTFKSTTPPTLANNGSSYDPIFFGCNSLSNIYVPFGTVRTYKGTNRYTAYKEKIKCKEVTIADVLATVSDFPSNIDDAWTNVVRTKLYKSGTDLKLENAKSSLTKTIPLNTTLSQDYSYSNCDEYTASIDGKDYYFYVNIETGELEQIEVSGFDNSLKGEYKPYYGTTVFDIVETNPNFPQTNDEHIIPIDAWKNESKEKVYKWCGVDDNRYMVMLGGFAPIYDESKVVADGKDYVYSMTDASVNITVKFVMVNDVLTRILVSGFSTVPGDYSKYDGLYTSGKYAITYGANSTIDASKDESARFESEADFSKFVGVEVDDSVVDPSYYEESEGSTVIEFNEEYIKSLTDGLHTLSIVSNDGFAMTTFMVINNEPTPTHRSKSKSTYLAPVTGVE